MKKQLRNETGKLRYMFFSKALFFPEQKILALGDLHLGYDIMMKNQGIFLPFAQIEHIKKEIKVIASNIKKQGYNIEKIVLLGDIKHSFNFDLKENFEIKDFIAFLASITPKENIILVRGNHDIAGKRVFNYRDFYISSDKKIAFIHGHEMFGEVLGKEIQIIVMAHIHPAVMIKDRYSIKKEKFKAYLVGNWKNKKVIIVPSFFPLIEGAEINEFYNFPKQNKNWAVISNKNLKNFDVYVIGKEKTYYFGKFAGF